MSDVLVLESLDEAVVELDQVVALLEFAFFDEFE